MRPSRLLINTHWARGAGRMVVNFALPLLTLSPLHRTPTSGLFHFLRHWKMHTGMKLIIYHLISFNTHTHTHTTRTQWHDIRLIHMLACRSIFTNIITNSASAPFRTAHVAPSPLQPNKGSIESGRRIHFLFIGTEGSIRSSSLRTTLRRAEKLPNLSVPEAGPPFPLLVASPRPLMRFEVWFEWPITKRTPLAKWIPVVGWKWNEMKWIADAGTIDPSPGHLPIP